MKPKLNAIPSALLESLCSIGYNLETALADIIDNSITADATNVSVRFLWNNGQPWIAVCDNGHGMSPKDLVEAMRFGSRSPTRERDSEDLGRFGLGMKTASISLCRQMVVASKKGRNISACEWNLEAMAASGAADWGSSPVDLKSLPQNDVLTELIRTRFGSLKSGTIVLWQKLHPSLGDPRESSGERRFSTQLGAARKHLELVFHRFLAPPMRQRKVCIDYNDSPLDAFDPFGTSNPARQELPAEKIHIQDQVITIQPYILPHRSKASSVPEYKKHAGDDGYLHNQGFYIYRNKRLIIKATWFQLIPKDELNKLIRIRVDLPNSLDDLWRIDVKKSQANPPESVRKELKRIIYKISAAGHSVFTTRAARMRNRKITPVWKREVAEGKVRYSVNEDHPLVKDLFQSLPREKAERLRACFELLNSTFPYDMYYADAACDQIEFANSAPDENTVRRVGAQLVQALRACGFKGEDLRTQMEATEFFKCTPELIAEILGTKGNGSGEQ